jgi:hypothetical protein
MLTREQLLKLINRNTDLAPILKEAIRDLVNDVLVLEAQQFIDENQEILPKRPKKAGLERLVPRTVT